MIQLKSSKRKNWKVWEAPLDENPGSLDKDLLPRSWLSPLCERSVGSLPVLTGLPCVIWHVKLLCTLYIIMLLSIITTTAEIVAIFSYHGLLMSSVFLAKLGLAMGKYYMMSKSIFLFNITLNKYLNCFLIDVCVHVLVCAHTLMLCCDVRKPLVPSHELSFSSLAELELSLEPLTH